MKGNLLKNLMQILTTVTTTVTIFQVIWWRVMNRPRFQCSFTLSHTQSGMLFLATTRENKWHLLSCCQTQFFFVFYGNKVIQIWTTCKWWQFIFWVNYPFKGVVGFCYNCRMSDNMLYLSVIKVIMTKVVQSGLTGCVVLLILSVFEASFDG